MRAIWEALYASLVRSIRVEQAVRAFQQVDRRSGELGRFKKPVEIILYLHGMDGDLDAKDRVLAALVGMIQRGEERDLALALLMLGLWPGLDAAFRRRIRRERIAPGEVAAAMLEHLAAQAERMDAARVNRVAATLVRSTEREVAADLRRQRPEAHEDPDAAYEEAICGAVDSLFDVPAGVDAEWELDLLRERISPVAGADAELVLAVAVAEFTQSETASSIGILPDAARKRFQRATRRLLAWLTEDDPLPESPRGTQNDTASTEACPIRRSRTACHPIEGRNPAGERSAPPTTRQPRRDPMGQDMWKQTEDMAKQHEQGASAWLKLQNDGDKAVVVFLGEPYPREVCFVEGKYMPFDDALKAQGLKPTLRIALNVALFDSKEMKVLEQGVTFFKDLVRVRDKYTLEKWAFEVQRHGAAKDPKTTYSILPEHQLTPEQIRTFNALERHDLQKLYESTPADEQTPVADGPIDPQLAQSLGAALKALPREAVDRFCQKFEVQRIKDLRASQADKARVFVEALVTEFSPDANVDPFA